ncbi:11788_t:CDS:1, partial [Ambispora gerdemannii]
SRPLGDESEIRDSVSSLNHNSSSLHTSVKTPNQQIKKKRPKPKSIRVFDLFTISDTQVKEVLNEEEK